jgi:two-component system response regulator HydG
MPSIQRINSVSSMVGSAAVAAAMGARTAGAAARLKDALRDPERQLIIDALEQTAWNRKKAAELLGINRTTLYNKMREYQLLKRRDGAVTKASS